MDIFTRYPEVSEPLPIFPKSTSFLSKSRHTIKPLPPYFWIYRLIAKKKDIKINDEKIFAIQLRFST